MVNYKLKKGYKRSENNLKNNEVDIGTTSDESDESLTDIINNLQNK
jgi:hypothetical protein